jgi:methylmalonyl-CoA/ethylmalonyl-CoA epimerase
MKLSALGQIALPVSNADASQAFYSDKLGLPFLFRFGDLVFYDCDGVRLMLEGSPKEPVSNTGVCFYFRVTGIEAVHVELQSRGVPFEDAPHLIARMPDHELWMAFFRDLDQHLLAIMEEKKG